MAKEKIPVYNIANLAARPLDANAFIPGLSTEFMIESFGPYLGRQSPHLHHPHRHSFYHLVCFTGGKGSHNIDFTQFPVRSGQVYFMIPGQVHSWNFAGQPSGYVINFSESFLKGFLLNPNYLGKFSFFSGNAADSVVQMGRAVQERVLALMEEMLGHYRDKSDSDLLRAELVQLFLLVQSGIVARKKSEAPVVTQRQQVLGSFRSYWSSITNRSGCRVSMRRCCI